jgi:hypothetical protein
LTLPPLGPGHHHVDVAAAAPGADEPLALWTLFCSYKAATGSARVYLPREAWTAVKGTFGSIVRSVLVTKSPPWLTSAMWSAPWVR